MKSGIMKLSDLRSYSPQLQAPTRVSSLPDRWGNIVAYTNTINFFGGSGEVVPGYGFLRGWTNELAHLAGRARVLPQCPAPGTDSRVRREVHPWPPDRSCRSITTPGDAIGLQVLGPGLHQAVAEPVRLGGGSALAINPGRQNRSNVPLLPHLVNGVRTKLPLPINRGL
jgi:gamma-glutamyltranspeptidase / glutathione hydrolase